MARAGIKSTSLLMDLVIELVPVKGEQSGRWPYFQQYLPFGFPEGILRWSAAPCPLRRAQWPKLSACIRGSSSSPFGKPPAPRTPSGVCAGRQASERDCPGGRRIRAGLLICGVSGLAGGQDIFTLGDRPGPDGQGLHLPRVVIFTSSQSAWSYMIPSPASSTSSRDFVQAGQVDVERTGSIAFCASRRCPTAPSGHRGVLNRCFPATGFIVRAHRPGHGDGIAAEPEQHTTDRMGSYAATVNDAAHREGSIQHRAVGLRQAPVLNAAREIQLVQPDLLRSLRRESQAIPTTASSAKNLRYPIPSDYPAKRAVPSRSLR